MILETERLILRKIDQNDFKDLSEILQDTDVMVAYEHTFSNDEVQDWLDNQLRRYKVDGFGLWAVILKETNEFIGQCGLTIQQIPDKQVIEIGYLFKKKYWHQGYATEAAIGCKEYAFNILNTNEVYSIIRDNNLASQKVALRNGMRVIGKFNKHYYNIDMAHLIFSVEK